MVNNLDNAGAFDVYCFPITFGRPSLRKLSLGFFLGWLLRKAIFPRQSKLFIQFTPKSILFCFVLFCFVFLFLWFFSLLSHLIN